jgi:hypothetical protein
VRVIPQKFHGGAMDNNLITQKETKDFICNKCTREVSITIEPNIHIAKYTPVRVSFCPICGNMDFNAEPEIDKQERDKIAIRRSLGIKIRVLSGWENIKESVLGIEVAKKDDVMDLIWTIFISDPENENELGKF